MGLFDFLKSRQARETELQARLRRGMLRIDRFLRQTELRSTHYLALARRAHGLGDATQFQMLAKCYAGCRDSAIRWEQYLVRLSAMQTRRDEARTVKEFLQSMDLLTDSILSGVDADEIAATQERTAEAAERCHQVEHTLAAAMGDELTLLDRNASWPGSPLQAPSENPSLALPDEGLLGDAASVPTSASATNLGDSFEQAMKSATGLSVRQHG